MTAQATQIPITDAKRNDGTRNIRRYRHRSDILIHSAEGLQNVALIYSIQRNLVIEGHRIDPQTLIQNSMFGFDDYTVATAGDAFSIGTVKRGLYELHSCRLSCTH